MISIILLLLEIVICIFAGIVLAFPTVALIFWIKKQRIKKKIHKLIEKGEFKLKHERDKQELEERRNDERTRLQQDHPGEPIFEGKRTVIQLEREFKGRYAVQNDVNRESGSAEPVNNQSDRKFANPDRQVEGRSKFTKPTII